MCRDSRVFPRVDFTHSPKTIFLDALPSTVHGPPSTASRGENDPSKGDNNAVAKDRNGATVIAVA